MQFPPAARAAFFIVTGTALLLPLTVDPAGLDSFRLPKELIFRASAIALAIIGTFAITAHARFHRIKPLLREPVIALSLLVVAWTLVTTVTSTNRLLSLQAMITVVSSAIFFSAAYLTLREKRFVALDAALAPAVINAIVIALQEYGIWQPFKFPEQAAGHLSSSALIGNPNDVGSYLVVPAVAATVASATTKGYRRLGYSVVASIVVFGLITSATRTAIIAFIVAMAVFIAAGSVRRAAIVTALLIVSISVLVWPGTSMGKRMYGLIRAARERHFDVVFSERLVPFLAAVDMFRDHPVIGVGPGCFKFQYMAYRVALTTKYPREWTQGFAMNWGEVHNDHLEILAETGAPGYILFLSAAALLVIPVLRDRRLDSRDPGERLARHLALPLAVVVFVVALGQFPLQLAAPRLNILYFAGLCCVRRENAA